MGRVPDHVYVDRVGVVELAIVDEEEVLVVAARLPLLAGIVAHVPGGLIHLAVGANAPASALGFIRKSN